ncbi:DUF6286 domain-containing protein [uncultured Corynebacterium sp.]|uniref:DUF6286 domain-containing protein n=1 Tax=uncultured Corynebacterium sp. TaxID=159447 RepID=UPI0025F68A31|nr:DUF6286 domain-containing protein [uncultured Corynebacterium sp.]
MNGQEPKASPAVRTAAVVLGVALIAAAVVCGREVWRISVNPQATSWVQPLVDIMATPTLQPWMVGAGAAAVVAGIVCLVLALRPRRRTHVELQAAEGPSGWVRQVDIARRCSAIARSIPGVTAARTQATRKRVLVTVNADAQDTGVVDRVREAIAPELEQLATYPELTVVSEHIEEVDNNV